MLSPSRSRCVKQVELLRVLALLLKQPTVTFSGYSVSSNESNEEEIEKPLARSLPSRLSPPLIPKLKQNAVLKALASTVTELEHPFFLGRSIADPLAPVTREKRMKYLMARDAGVKAAEYVIQKWPELFPSRDFSPDIRPRNSEQEITGDCLEFLVSQRNTDGALELFRKLEEEGKKVPLETRNNLLELLCYDGVGNDTMVTNRSKFIEHQRLLNDREDLEFIPAKNPTAAKKLSPIQATIDDNQILLLSKSENHEYSKLKYPRIVWSLDNSAEKLLELMEDKNSITYDALMLGLFKYKSYDRMFHLYFTMQRAGYQSSVSTYNYLLKALDHSECSAVWEIAMELVKNMGRKPVVLPDTTTFNMLLKLSKHAGNDSRQTAAAVFQEMLHLDIEPNLTTFLRLLQIYIGDNDPSAIVEIVDYLEQHPQVLRLSSYFDLFFFEAAMNVANHYGRHDISKRLVEMASKDSWHLVSDIDKFLAPYLVAVSWGKDMHAIMETYKWLVSQYYRPKDWIYAALFQACVATKSPECVPQLWADFKRFGVRLESNLVVKSIHEALALVANVDAIDKYVTVADESWTMLQTRKILPDYSIIDGMVRISARAGQYEKAWRYYAQFESYNYQASSSALQHILDAYAIDTRNIVEVMDILRMMIAKGHHKPKNYDSICTDFGISTDFWDKTKAAPKDRYLLGKVDSQKKDHGGVTQAKKTKGRILARHKHGAAVRVQGNALSVTQHTLAYFFQEYGVEVEDIKVRKHRSGQPTGEALVVFPSVNHAEKAIKEKQKQTLGKGPLALSFKSFSYGVTVIVKGIPYNVTEQKIAEFLKEYDVQPERDVYIEIRPDGKLTGDAFVTFSSPLLAERAVKEKSKKRLGKRTVNLSIKSYSGNYGDGVEVGTHVDHDYDQSSQVIDQDGDTLLVEGLIPFSTAEDELAAFFNVDSKDVKLEVDETGRPTGIAMVKFPSAKLAVEAMKQKHEQYFLGRPLQLLFQNKSKI